MSPAPPTASWLAGIGALLVGVFAFGLYRASPDATVLDLVLGPVLCVTGILFFPHPGAAPVDGPGCSFCRRPVIEVAWLVTGPTPFAICDRCVGGHPTVGAAPLSDSPWSPPHTPTPGRISSVSPTVLRRAVPWVIGGLVAFLLGATDALAPAVSSSTLGMVGLLWTVALPISSGVQSVTRGRPREIRACSFCESPRHDLLSGPGVAICDPCVQLCREILADPTRRGSP